MTCEDCENADRALSQYGGSAEAVIYACALEGMDDSLGRRGFHMLKDKARNCGNFAAKKAECTQSC